MAKIRIDTAFTIADGAEVSFTAPCDCTAIDGLIVYYPGGSKAFTFKDAHSNNLTGIGNLFKSGAIVKALLDVKNGHAYLQNADTNAYLESRFADKLPLAGGNMQGSLNMGGNSIWGLADPSGYDQPVHYRMFLDELAKKAPSGYGLGNSDMPTITDFNQAIYSGWYRYDRTSANSPHSSTTGFVRVDSIGNGSDAAIEQKAWSHNWSSLGQVQVKRVCHNGVWSEWDFEHPLMANGGEYRTTERLNGKAVYKRYYNGVLYYRLEDETGWKLYSGTSIKLWENASRTSSFAAQTISLDLSAFDEVLVYSCLEGSRYNDYMVVSRCPVGETLLSHYQWADDGVALHRNATTRTNGIEFNNAYHGGGLDNASVIPYRIYGIKGGSI